MVGTSPGRGGKHRGDHIESGSSGIDGSAGPQLATMLRFVATGLTGSELRSGVVALGVLTALPDLAALNLIATIVSTVLSSELHRRFTFQTTDPGSMIRGQTAGGGMALVGLVVNSFVLAGWNVLVPDAGDGFT
jgi:putative flippase GtrA